MKRLFVLLFGVVCYLIFFATFVYQIGFVGNWVVPKGIDDGAIVERWPAAVINIGLLGLFAVQHTIMARIAFKRWWTTIVPEPLERSLFVLLASLLLLLMNWQWRPMPTAVWQVDHSLGRALLSAISLAGWGLVLYSTWLINHFDLFGLRQVWLYYQGREYTQVPFKETVLYQWVRHPLMLGFIVAFWATPDMTQGHLLFAVVTTAYILIAIQIEERTLLAIHGDQYRQYQQRVSMIVPLRRRSIE
jgi:protein-S-isoprenylcysteine O-methyltransferase Ste14